MDFFFEIENTKGEITKNNGVLWFCVIVYRGCLYLKVQLFSVSSVCIYTVLLLFWSLLSKGSSTILLRRSYESQNEI